jgi:hypothetical protein
MEHPEHMDDRRNTKKIYQANTKNYLRGETRLDGKMMQTMI